MSIKRFENKDFDLSVEAYIDDKQNVWFKGENVALALGYKNTVDAIQRHVDGKYQRVVKHAPWENMHPQTIFISEPGMYSLIFGSKLESAEVFKDWIFSEVLPSIRKYGQYRLFNNPNNQVFKIENETDLHNRVVTYIRRYYPDALIVPGLGELQYTKSKRIDSYRKGYQKGQPDLIIQNLHKHYCGFCLELKTPMGNGVLSDAQKQLLRAYEDCNYKCLVSSDYDQIITEIIEYMRDIRVKCKLCNRLFKTSDTLRNHIRYIHNKNKTYGIYIE